MDLRPGELPLLKDKDNGDMPYGYRLPDGREVPFSSLVSDAGIFSKLKRQAALAEAGNPDSLAVLAGATQTATASLHVSLTKEINMLAAPGKFRHYGGARYTVSAVRVAFAVSSSFPANGNLNGMIGKNDYDAFGWGVGIRTDSSKVSFKVFGFTSRYFRVLVDDGTGLRYVNKTSVAYSVNNGISYVEVDFGGVYKLRDIYLEGDRNVSVYGVFIEPSCDASAPTVRDKIVALMTGNSYQTGTGASSFNYGMSWGQIMGRRLGWADVRQVAVGGTDLFADSSGNSQPVLQQVSRWLAVNSDLTASDVGVINIAGLGINDYTAYNASTITAAQLTAAAAELQAAIRAAFPSALQLWYGTWPGRRGPDAATLAIEAAIQAGVTLDSLTKYIPVSADLSPWIYGTGYVGATNGSGNSDRAIAADALHPSDYGHQLLADRGTGAVRALLA
jgi:lysophospholipase L1-like esterase